MFKDDARAAGNSWWPGVGSGAKWGAASGVVFTYLAAASIVTGNESGTTAPSVWESITFVLLGGSLYALMGAAVGALVGAALGGVLGMLLGVSAARWPASSRALARRGAIIGAVGTLALVPMAQASMAAGWQWATLAYAPVFARASYRHMLDLVKRQETGAMASCSPG